MKASELREKSVEELRTLSEAERKALFDLRFQHYTGQLMNTASLFWI
jgi:ribosomal protein L29